MMKQYKKYKDSGIEWVGEIPSHWDVKTFNYLFEFSRGLTITKLDLKNDGVPCVNYGEIHSKFGFKVKPEVHLLKKVDYKYLKSSQRSLLSEGDFVFADTSEDIDGSGNFTCLASDIPTFAGYHTIIARQAKNKNNYNYLAYYFDSLEFRNQIRSEVSGIKVFSITQSILKNTKILLPGAKEQTAIATYLDRKIDEIDSLIEDKKRLLKLYEEEKSAIINQAVTKGINPKAKMKDSGIEWLGEIPKHWEIKKIKHVVTKIGSGITPTGGANVYQSSGIPLLRSQNIHFDGLRLDDVAYITEEIHHKMGNSKVLMGDVLLNITGASIGRTYFVDKDLGESNVNQHVCILRPYKTILTKYLYFILRSNIGQQQIKNEQTGSGREGLNFETIKNFFIPLFSTKEQHSIVHYIETACARIDAKIAKTKKLIELLTEYRVALISEVVTGKIKVE